MSEHLSRLIGRFSGLDVVVVGEAMLDTYLRGSIGRICREAPVPIVDIASRQDAPGGAANAAANVRSLGAGVRFLSVVGDDAEGALLRRRLEDVGVATEGILTQAGRATLVKQRVLADSQMLLRFDQGSTDPIDARTEAALIDRLLGLAPRCGAVIVSDYGHGVLTTGLIRALEHLLMRPPRVLVVDSRSRLAAFRGTRPTAVKPNYDEAIQILGARALGDGTARVEVIAAHGGRILERTGARIAAVTLDCDGSLVFERGRPLHRTYARPGRPGWAAGAGDTFVAAMALALATGGETTEAAEIASAACSLVVGKEGTAACSARELRTYLGASDRGPVNLASLAEILDTYRRQGKRVVFTNGCFDILHRGHVTYLNQAKALADVLIVGVNADTSIRRLKGPGRPINTLEDRIGVLVALSCIDHIIPFEEDSPVALIAAIRPDVFVKGGDYTPETIPEAPLVAAMGGEVRVLPYVEHRSTTGLIERIRAASDGADGRGDGRHDAIPEMALADGGPSASGR